MPATLASRPTSCGGHKPSGLKISSSNQLVSPAAMANRAPWVLARFQYSPNTRGTKAITSVTL